MVSLEDRKAPVLVAVRHLVQVACSHGNVIPALSDYISSTSQLPIAKLDSWEKAFRREIFIGQGSTYIKESTDRPLIPWLDHCNGNGYLREEALRSLNEGAPNGFLFAMVLRRLNDWVPQVRAAARAHIPEIASKTELGYVLEALWAILPSFHTWGRLEPEDLEVLMGPLALEGLPVRLASQLSEVTAGPAAFILEQVGRTSVLDNFLGTLAARAVQPSVRAKAYQSLLEKNMVWFEGRKWTWTDIRWCKGYYAPVLGKREIQVRCPVLEMLEKASKDKSPVVRRVAGNVLLAELDSLGASALLVAEILAKDVYPSVAERGTFALKRLQS